MLWATQVSMTNPSTSLSCIAGSTLPSVYFLNFNILIRPSLKASVHELGNANHSFKRSDRKADVGLAAIDDEMNFNDAHDDVSVSRQNSSTFSFDLNKGDTATSTYRQAEGDSGPLTLLANDEGNGDDRFSRRFVHGNIINE